MRGWLRKEVCGGIVLVALLAGADVSLADPEQPGCWVTGGGTIEDTEIASFGGNAETSRDGNINGSWHHADLTTGESVRGRAGYLLCRRLSEDGPGQPGGKTGLVFNQVYFGGPAEWRDPNVGAWVSGYWFDVVAEDHGGQVPGTYHITVRILEPPGTVYDAKGEIVGGNVQIHPPNSGHP